MHETTFLEAYPFGRRTAEVQSIGITSVIASMILNHEGAGPIAWWRALRSFDPSRSSLKLFVEQVIASQVTSVPRFQGAPNCRPVFFNAPAVMAYEATELPRNAGRVLVALSNRNRRLGCPLIDQAPLLDCFVSG